MDWYGIVLLYVANYLVNSHRIASVEEGCYGCWCRLEIIIGNVGVACLLVKTLLVLPIFKSLRARTVTLRYCMLYVCCRRSPIARFPRKPREINCDIEYMYYTYV
jgi:hypothetical protein